MLQAIIDEGGAGAAARKLAVDKAYPARVHKAVQRRAALQGYAPEASNMQGGAPSGFLVKRHSARFDKEGRPAGGWVISEPAKEAREAALREFVEWLSQDAKGKAPLTQAPPHVQDDLLAVYPVGDPHFGLYSWSEETGDDFDLEKAESLTCGAIDRLVASAPDAGTGLFVNLGDAFHADDSSNRTPASGNSLDVDTRFAKVAQVGLRSMVHCVRRLLEKHSQVIVWNIAGNHDPHSAVWLALCMDAYFANEPRVTVDLSPSLYKYHRFGKCLIGAHHGHGAKGADLPLLMATDRKDDWAASDYRVWLCGHIHHYSAKEHPGATVETFRTLAGKDAWHAGKGYRSGRDMNVITFHKEFGEFQRTRCDLKMLQAA